jgi:hypothetical protein
MIVLPFEKEHLQRMVIQQRQQGLEHLLTEEIYAALANSQAYTALDEQEVLACGGTVELAPGRACAWAYVSANVGSRMKFVTKVAHRFLAAAQFRRIEMDVDCDFPQAHRWAKMLGFNLECERRKSFTPDGRDCALYAMVKV